MTHPSHPDLLRTSIRFDRGPKLLTGGTQKLLHGKATTFSQAMVVCNCSRWVFCFMLRFMTTLDLRNPTLGARNQCPSKSFKEHEEIFLWLRSIFSSLTCIVFFSYFLPSWLYVILALDLFKMFLHFWMSPTSPQTTKLVCRAFHALHSIHGVITCTQSIVRSNMNFIIFSFSTNPISFICNVWDDPC